MDIWNLFSPTITNIVLVIALVCIISNQRHIRRLEAQLEALKEKKVEEESVPAIEPAIPETKTNEKALVKAENERPLAIVKTNHEKVRESEKSSSGPIVEDGIDEETVAVIAAAVVACGYVPLAVRKAHRHKRRHTKWIMAGRLAGMR